MNEEIKIGTKIKGFKFDNSHALGYGDLMNRYIDRIGIITQIDDNDVKIAFYFDDKIPEFTDSYDITMNYHETETFETSWYYPLDKAYDHIVTESNDLFPIY